MNFQLNEDIQFLKDNVRDFVQSEVEKVAKQIEEDDKIPEHIIEMSKEMGLFGLSIPEEYGGLGIGMVGKCALRSEEHTSELQSRFDLVCRLLLEKKNRTKQLIHCRVKH